MSVPSTEVRLTLDAGPDADISEVAALARQVRTGLLDLDAVESVELARTGTAPSDSKAGDVVAWGELIVAIGGAGGALTALIGALQSWVSRDERRSVTIEIDGKKLVIAGASPEDRTRL